MGGEQTPWYQRHSAQESERNKYLGSISKRITAQRKRDSTKTQKPNVIKYQADTLLKQLQASSMKRNRSICIKSFFPATQTYQIQT